MTASGDRHVVTVAVVDDQPLIRAGLRMIIDSRPDLELVGEAGDGAEAVVLARETVPDVVVMDIRMPGVNGIDAIDGVLSAGPQVRVLMLTTFDIDGYVYDSLHAGASGFLLKDASPEQLVEGIRTVAAGEVLLAPSLTRRLVEDYVRRPPAPDVASGPLARLTVRERDVLRVIAAGLSNTEIARRLYVSEATVKTHVSRILAKLGTRDRVQAVIAAYEFGLVAPGDKEGTVRRPGGPT